MFQRNLSSDINSNIKTADKLLVPADKTSNFYKMDTQSYTKLLQKNITKNYKKVPPGITNSIEVGAKAIAKKLHLDDRINTTAKHEAFITLTDHKPNYANSPTCRLINPAKSEIGKISKQLLEHINTNILSKLKLNQWKNTKAVLFWFNDIRHKDLSSFMAFDMVEFYQSIFVKLLDAALEFASKNITISDNDRYIIHQAKSSLIYNAGEPWSTKMSSNLFDVTMGSYDGAKTCELVGSHLLNNIQGKFVNACNFGLYRDDGLGVMNASPRQTEIIKKELCNIFGKFGLKITIEPTKK